MAGKRLELLKETVPKLSRVAVLWDPKNQGSEQSWKASQLSARELGLQLHSMEVSSADKFEGAFQDATKARSAALAVTLNAVANSNQKRIAELAAKNRLPAIYARGDFVASGGLVSYGADQAEPYRRAAAMVDKILKGTKPMGQKTVIWLLATFLLTTVYLAEAQQPKVYRIGVLIPSDTWSETLIARMSYTLFFPYNFPSLFVSSDPTNFECLR